MTKRACLMLAVLSVLVSASAAFAQVTARAVIVNPAERHSAPAFRLRDATGKVVALSGLRGKTVVVNLWATECGGCKTELPSFVELYRTFKGQGLAVIGVSMDVMYDGLKTTSEGWTKVKPFAVAHDLRYTILMDDGSVEKAYKVTAMPATYLIDRSGRIAATYVGVVDASDLTANVRTLLSESK